MSEPFTFGVADEPVMTTAIHAGHRLRASLLERTALDDAGRLREEDPFTDRLARVGGLSVVVHRSRFEVDLNRPRGSAVYQAADEAWGVDPWRTPLPASEVALSLRTYDSFYAAMRRRLDEMARNGPFVVLDLHSYNHRRGGPDSPPAPSAENPEVNVGTGSLDDARWGHVRDSFMTVLGSYPISDHDLDVRENVRFRGGHFSRWINERYDGAGCALAIEFKKGFMDEWTGEVHLEQLAQLRRALHATVDALVRDLTPTAAR